MEQKVDDHVDGENIDSIHIGLDLMEDLLEKLKIMSYEEEIVKVLKLKHLTRHYFAFQTNSGEQFYYFTSIAAWLIRKIGRQFDQPQEFDDPNSTIANILDAVRELKVPVDFPPSKLKQGYGWHVIYILDQLANAALTAVHFKWEEPIYPSNDVINIGDESNESELVLERIEEQLALEYSDDETGLLQISDSKNITLPISKPEAVLESTTNIEDWKLELERVIPHLKVVIKTDTNDWRSHLDNMQKYHSDIEESLSSTKSLLDRLKSDIESSLEKIGIREKYINDNLEISLETFRDLQDELTRLTEQYREASVGVTERSRTLASVTEELESVKQEMEERGSSMTDGSPLVNIKKAIAKIKNEITVMDLQIGVAEHSLLQAKLRDKSLLQKDLNTPPQHVI